MVCRSGRATRLALLPATQSAEGDGHAGRLLVDSPACDMTGAAGGGGGGGGGGGTGEADAEEEEEGAVTCAAMGRDMGTGGIQQRKTAAGEEEDVGQAGRRWRCGGRRGRRHSGGERVQQQRREQARRRRDRDEAQCSDAPPPRQEEEEDEQGRAAAADEMRHQRTARGGRAGQLLSSSQQQRQQRPSPCQSALSTGRRPAQRRRKRDERPDARKWCEMRGDTTPVDERQSCTAMPSPRVLGRQDGEMAPFQSNHHPDPDLVELGPCGRVHCLLSGCVP